MSKKLFSEGPNWEEINAAALLAEANYRHKKRIKGEAVDIKKLDRAIERSKGVREAGKRFASLAAEAVHQ